MEGLGQVTNALWLLTVLAQAGLLMLLWVRKATRQYPALCVYLSVTIAQAGVLFTTYRLSGFNSAMSWRVAWGTQSIVLMARAGVVLEICRLVLGTYRGIWALARRTLLICASLVLGYALLASYRQWRTVLTTAELALELTTATVIVVLLLFARYYGVEVPRDLRWLAVGLCLYSCIAVLNNAVLEQWLNVYLSASNALGMSAFLMCLLAWSWAFRNWKQPARAKVPELERATYLAVIPKVNWQLQALNEQLIRFWRLEAPGA